MLAVVPPPITGKTRDALLASWRAVAATKVAIDLPRLMDAIGRIGKGSLSSTQTVEQLERLADGWLPDPRTTGLVVRVLETRPFATSSGTQKVYRRLFDVVEAHADPRAADALAALPINRIFQATTRGEQMRGRATHVIDRLRADHPPAPVDELDRAALARVDHAYATGLALRGDVAVLRDWILSRANPRTEWLAAGQ
jgi:hypothetical protein